MNKQKLFGKRIKELRKNKNLTQEQLAESVGVYQKQIGNIETGTYFTTMPNLEKIANALNVQIKDLFDFEHLKNDDELKEELIFIIKNAPKEKLKTIYRIIKDIID